MKLKFLLMLVFLIAVSFWSLKTGSTSVTWSQIFEFLSLSPQASAILTQLRGPRILSAALVGGSLGIVGLVFQTLLRNPLAEPYTLGLSGGSSLGAVLALNLALTPSLFWIPFLSTVGCFTSAFLVLILARRQLELESRSLILFGIMISLFFGALVVTGMSFLSPDKLQGAMFWLLGEFGTTRDQWIYFLGPMMILGAILLIFKARSLDVLALGEARGLSLGFSPQKERVQLIIISTFLTALGVSIAGLIGFIGLVTPHLVRRFLKTSRHKILLLGSGLLGSTLLIVADTVGRTVAKNIEVPAGSIAALFGAPILIYFLVGQSHASTD